MSYSWPHDDRNSLIAFYDRPWLDAGLLCHVTPPFQMKYEGALIHGILIHEKCYAALTEALRKIWDAYDHDQKLLDATGFTEYGGSYNYRNVRDSASLSCHAFGAAIDVGMSKFPLGGTARFPDQIVNAFKNVGAFYGGDFKHRPDGMHFQFAHE